MDEFSDKLSQFALYGSLEVFEYMGRKLKESTGIRDYIRGEQTVKMLHLVYLNLCTYYRVLSEAGLNKKFADILGTCQENCVSFRNLELNICLNS